MPHPSQPRTAGRQLLRRAERRTSLVEAAAAAFARTGFQATSMDDVAVEAGVTRLIVYRHFESKEQLYRAVLEEVSLDLVHTLEERAREGTAAADGAVIGAMLAVARRHPDGFRLLWLHAQREPAFADYAARLRVGAVAFAGELGGANLPSVGPLHAWSADFMVTSAVEAVLGWLGHGDPSLDASFVTTSTAGFRAMLLAWGAVSATPVATPAGPT